MTLFSTQKTVLVPHFHSLALSYHSSLPLFPLKKLCWGLGLRVEARSLAQAEYLFSLALSPSPLVFLDPPDHRWGWGMNYQLLTLEKEQGLCPFLQVFGIYLVVGNIYTLLLRVRSFRDTVPYEAVVIRDKKVNPIQGCCVCKPTELIDLKPITQRRHYLHLPGSWFNFNWFSDGYKRTRARAAHRARNGAWWPRQRLHSVSVNLSSPNTHAMPLITGISALLYLGTPMPLPLLGLSD